MTEDLKSISAEFQHCRGSRKKSKYPESLWSKALGLCLHYEKKTVAKSLGVSLDRLQHRLRAQSQNLCKFKEVKILHQEKMQIHIHSNIPLTIDFQGSSKELVDFIKLLSR